MKPIAESAILFVVDGMRPDGVLQANTPTMHALMQRGASTFSAQTVMPSVTLPTHMSMFHGVPVEVHTVTDNTWHPMPGWPIPGIIDLVRMENRKPVAFYTWEQLRDIWRPGSVAYSSFINMYGPDGAGSDMGIACLAADYLEHEQPDFTFIYLGMVDDAGHQHGWLSAEYQQSIAAADAAIAHVLERLECVGRLEHTALLLTADHGGHERSHGMDIPEDMTIPWMLAGPGIKKSYSIAGPVRIYDTAPTLAHLLGLSIPAEWQGQPVLEALE